MQINHAVLLVVAAGVARLLQVERHHRRETVLRAAGMHQALLADVAANPERWVLTGEEMSAEEYARHVNVNRQVSLLAAKFRVGLLDRRTLRVQAHSLMRHENVREYWARVAAFREDEALDRIDDVFNAILTDECALFSGRDPLTS
ncbi:DUF6082 family protein [Streptomyces sp. NBC_00820]|uniref:DUF6082 family protein n=1 Tax=Streptomyces sp. NBC_00820 TaxID=2975842 RepID=UPI002ED5FB6F|nr:DUF6082 family protein [Streptomyces sp. NBC_00820]